MSEIIRLYKSGLSLVDVGAELGLKPYTVLKTLIKAGVPRRPRLANIRTYAVNEDYFERIDTPEKAYWMGFLAADGNISYTENNAGWRLTLGVGQKDWGHIAKFAEAVEAEQPIMHRARKNWTGTLAREESIVICSKKLCTDLIKVGLTERKSLTLEPWKGKFRSHYLRGLWDGDGGISCEKDKPWKWTVYLCGTSTCIEFFAAWVRSVVPTRGEVPVGTISHRGKVWEYNLGGSHHVRNFCDAIYEESTPETRLDRKWNLSLQVRPTKRFNAPSRILRRSHR